MSAIKPTPTDLGLPESWHHKATEAIRIRDWFAISMMVGSHERPPLLEALWPFLTDAEKPDLFASCISCGDFPSQVAWFLADALEELREAGTLVFDGDTARARYAELPDEIDVYRGTVQAEVDDGLSGICWTLNPELATWFATTHGRFRNTQSPPVVVSANVHKAEIVGLLTDRREDEVLLNPRGIYEFDVRAAA